MLKKIALIAGTGLLSLSAPVAAVAKDGTPAIKAGTAPVDPARLVIAQKAVVKLIPPGTYQKMMKDVVDQMTNGMIGQMMGMDASVFAKAGGVEEGSEAAKAIDGKSLGDLASEKDPYFKERMDITMKVMFDEMGKMMADMEPSLRTAMANIYARKYTVQQLRDIEAFFATPTGTEFAGNFMATFTDKEMMQVSMSAMPKMMEAIPEIMKKVEAATAHLPKPKTDEVGATAAVDAMDGSADAAIADPNANETGEEPWYSEDNWTPTQQKKVAALNDKYAAANDKQVSAYDAYQSEYDKAVAAARAKLKPDYDKMVKDEPPMAAEDIPATAPPPPVIIGTITSPKE
jgi:hypothetical protein